MRAASPIWFDDLSPEERSRLRNELGHAATWLRQRLDVRSTVYLRGSRLGRIGAVSVAVAFVSYKVLSSALALPNIALHKPVTASGLAQGHASADGLVDGVKDGVIGVQTTAQEQPWVQIDLGGIHMIKRVVVYNRGDGNLNDGLPYTLDVSEDGADYKPQWIREKPFGDGSFLSPPWAAGVGVRGRFVRLRAQRYIALSEVEVFGKP
jgi:hypothetical protein